MATEAEIDEIAWIEGLYRDHREFLTGLAERFTGHGVRADDIAQKTLISAWNSRDVYDHAAKSARPWLITLLKHIGVSEVRKGCHKKEKNVDFDMSELVLEDPENQPLGVSEQHEEKEGLETALRVLPSNYGSIVRLCYFDTKTHEEVAETLNLTRAAVRSRLSRAMAGLKWSLAKHAPEGYSLSKA